MIECQNLDKGKGGEGGVCLKKVEMSTLPLFSQCHYFSVPPHCVLPINTLSLTVVTVMLDAFQGFL